MAHRDAPRQGTVTSPIDKRRAMPRRPLMLLVACVLGLIPAVATQLARPTRVAASSAVENSFISAVAAPAAGSSVAVGWYSNGSIDLALVDIQTNGAWLPYVVPMPSGVNQNGSKLNAVSCPSTGVCVAAGWYDANSGYQQPLIVSLSSGALSAVAGPLPSGANSVPDASLTAVSCASTTVCAAAGTYADSSSDTQGVLEMLSSGTWTATQAPLPGDAATNPGVTLSGLTCPSTTVCEAVGAYTNTSSYSSPSSGLVDNLSSGTWAATEAPAPSGSSAEDGVDLSGISCPSTSSCVAVGYYVQSGNTYNSALAEVLSSGSWTGANLPLPSNAEALFSMSKAVTCTGVGACVAIGMYHDTTGYQYAMSDTLASGSWSTVEAAVPSGAFTTSLDAATCTSSTSCVAVGSWDSGGVLLEVYGSGVWSVSSGIPSIAVANTPLSIACASAGNCVVGGLTSYTNLANEITPGNGMIETETSGTWSWQGSGLPSDAPTGGGVVPAEHYGGGQSAGACSNAGQQQGMAADPIDTESGNFAQSLTDISIHGRSCPLEITRTYNSALAGTSGAFGNGWTFNYAMSLSCSGTTVTITQENGSQVTFTTTGTCSSGTWTPSAPRFMATLSLSGTTWSFKRQGRDTYTFNSSGQLTQIADLNGYTTTLTYTSGKLTTITDQAGRTLTLGWTGSNITTLTDPNVTPSRTVTYSYTSGNLTSVTDVNGGISDFGYDSSSRLVQMRSARYHSNGTLPTPPSSCSGSGTSDTVTNHYDGSGRVDCQWDQNDNETTLSYAGSPGTAAGGTTTITDPAGNVTVDGYAYGVRVLETRGSGTAAAATTLWQYDPATLAFTAVINPNGGVTTFSVDSSGNILSSLDPLGRTTTNTYNSFNEVLTSEDGNGVTTTYTYDSNGNPLTVSTPLTGASGTATNCKSPSTAVAIAQVTCFTFGDSVHPGDVTQVTDPDGQAWQYTYDLYGDRTTAEDPLGNTSTYQYNADGWMTASFTPKGANGGAGLGVSGGGIATGNGWSLAMDGSGTPWAWGYNGDGEAGNGTTTTPVTSPGKVCAAGQTAPCSSFFSGAVSSFAGGSHGVVAKSDGTVWAWGNNANGELGSGTTTNSTVPVQATGLSGVTITQIAAGANNTEAVSSAGNVYAWGNNGDGQLGQGTTTSSSSPKEVCAPGTSSPCSTYLSGITTISTHDNFDLALKSDGTVWAWGHNAVGELGDGTTTRRKVPVEVCAPGQTSPCSSFLSGIVAISAGDSTSMALKSDGSVYVWGANDKGQLASGSTDSSAHSIPVQISGLPTITAISAGDAFALAVASDGTGRSWGDNDKGQLGIGSADTTGCKCRTSVQTISTLTNAVTIAAGFFASLATDSSGQVWSWGGNSHGELGRGSTSSNYPTPAVLTTLTGIGPNNAYRTQYAYGCRSFVVGR